MKRFVISIGFGVLLAILTAGLYLWAFQNSSSQTDLPSRFNDVQYRSESLPVGDDHVSVYVSTELTECVNPLISLSDRDEYLDITFSGEYGNCVTLNAFKVADLDQDDTDEIVTEWTLHWGGSGGYTGLVVFKIENNTLVPFTGYPVGITPEDRTVQVITQGGNLIGEYSTTFDNNLTYLQEYVSSPPKFYFGKYDYVVLDEAHVGPHYWNISRYVFENGQFVEDISWNSGNPARTNEKYMLDPDEILMLKMEDEITAIDTREPSQTR